MQDECFAERGENRGIQRTKEASLCDKTLRQGREGASYRRIRVYTKTMVRYRKERERRRQVRLLSAKGFTQEQIARELGVSTRTVKRDWAKVAPYVTAQRNGEVRRLEEERRLLFWQRCEGLTVSKRIALMCSECEELIREAKRLEPILGYNIYRHKEPVKKKSQK